MALLESPREGLAEGWAVVPAPALPPSSCGSLVGAISQYTLFKRPWVNKLTGICIHSVLDIAPKVWTPRSNRLASHYLTMLTLSTQMSPTWETLS